MGTYSLHEYYIPLHYIYNISKHIQYFPHITNIFHLSNIPSLWNIPNISYFILNCRILYLYKNYRSGLKFICWSTTVIEMTLAFFKGQLLLHFYFSNVDELFLKANVRNQLTDFEDSPGSISMWFQPILILQAVRFNVANVFYSNKDHKSKHF